MNYHKFIYDGRVKTIRQKTDSANWTLRETIDGKLVNLSFPTCHRADAERAARDYLRGRRDGKGEQLRALLRQRKPIQQSPKGPLIGEVIEAYRTASSGPLERTRRENITCLRSVIQRVLGPEPEWTHRPLATLTKELVRGYKNLVAESAKKAGASLAETGRHQRTANSTLRQARSIFSEEMLEYYQVNCGFSLNTTTLREFKDSPAFLGLRKPTYRQPDDSVLAEMIQALEEIRLKDPEVYLICWLGLTFGLRKSEVSPLTTDCFIRLDGEVHVEIRMVESRGALRDQTKNGQVVPRVKAANGGWARIGPMIEQMPRGRYLISGSDTERTDRVFRRVNAWLASHGFSTEKKFHELRALAGSRVIMNDGIEAASAWLRHGSISTTQAHYGRYAKCTVRDIPITFAEPRTKLVNPEPFGEMAPAARSVATVLATVNSDTDRDLGYQNNWCLSAQIGAVTPAQSSEDKGLNERKLLE